MTEQQIRNFSFQGERIPEHMIAGVLRYFNDHIRPGDFLYSLLANDFMGSYRCADDKKPGGTPYVGGFSL